MADEVNGKITIELTQDLQEAKAKLTAPGEGGEPAGLEQVKQALADAGVTFGIVPDSVIKWELKKSKRRDVEFTAAQGEAPGQGYDAYISYKWKKKEYQYDEKDIKDNFVPPENLPVVEPGAMIARKVNATRGDAGTTVTGERIPGEWGVDVTIGVGANVETNESASKFFSRIEGVPQIIDGTLSVHPLRVIDGDVDESTEDIVHDGALQINGKVSENSYVKAGGNILVKGNIESSKVESGGNVIVTGGIITRDTGKVIAGGAVIAEFIEISRIQAAGDVIAMDAIINSAVRSNGTVICSSKKGRIIGGDITARNGIRARILGSASGAETVLRAGMKFAEYIDIYKAEKEIENARRAVDEARQHLETHHDTTPDEQARLEGVIKKYSDLQETLTKKIEEHRSSLTVNRNAVIKGESVIHPDCVVHAGRVRQRIKDTLKFATLFSRRGGALGVTAYDETIKDIRNYSISEMEQAKTVLVVDDAQIMRYRLKTIIEFGDKYEVVAEAEDGRRAVEMFEKYRPDIVTMDITMPNFDGIMAVKEIMKIDPKARIVMISALGQEDKIRESIAAGAKAFIVKPFVADKVLDIIDKIFE